MGIFRIYNYIYIQLMCVTIYVLDEIMDEIMVVTH